MTKFNSQTGERAYGLGARQVVAVERAIPARMNNSGAALVIALMAMLLLLALGLMLVLSTAAETLIAGHFRTGQEAFYAADAGLERVIDELAGVADWNSVLQGTRRSAFTDGSPSGVRTLSDGSAINLTGATNVLNCGHAGACTPPEMDASTATRPWGANNPRWCLFAYGPLSAMVPTGTINSSVYVAVWVSDDASENDADPTSDTDDPSIPASGVVTVHAEAFGPGGTHRALEATVGRRQGGIRVIAWREL